MPKPKPAPVPLRKRILYYTVFFVMLALIMELLARAWYYQQLSSGPSAAFQAIKDVARGARSRFATDTLADHLRHDQYLVRPLWPATENDRVNEEHFEANKAEYVPWVDFAFRDFSGKYVNVHDHVRRSVPDRSDSNAQQPLRVFFLGGSTTYGYNVADDETIPSCFVREYRQKYPAGRPIQVFNLGMPSYFSYQELTLLANKLFQNNKPDMVIMLDGLNDCLQAKVAIRRAPLYTPGLPGTIKNGDNPTWKATDYDLPADMTVDSACATVARNYLENITHAHAITGCDSIALYCFWQPVPYYNYPNRRNDPICIQTPSERFGYIYPIVKSSAGRLPWLYFLGDMLQEEKGLPFIDEFHYSPAFNDAVAKKMLGVISWQ